MARFVARFYLVDHQKIRIRVACLVMLDPVLLVLSRQSYDVDVVEMKRKFLARIYANWVTSCVNDDVTRNASVEGSFVLRASIF